MLPNTKLTEFEKDFLDKLWRGNFLWLARDKNLKLYAYETKPTKVADDWWEDEHDDCLEIYNVFDTFDFVQWEDDEPTNIENVVYEDRFLDVTNYNDNVRHYIKMNLDELKEEVIE